MIFKPKSVMTNSITSIAASGILIFSTILTPFFLSRTLTDVEYRNYAAILALLPLLNILAQSIRIGSATRIRLALKIYPSQQVYLSFSVIITCAIAMSLVLASGIFALYFSLGNLADADTHLLRIGAACLSINVCGTIALALITGLSSAKMDFLPENLAKAGPNIFILLGLMMIFVLRPENAYVWTFVVVLSGPWLVFLLLAGAYFGEVKARYFGQLSLSREIAWNFTHGIRGLFLWNLASYLATTVSVTIVAVYHTTHIVSFTIATSLTGVIAAGLIAVSGPIASRVAGSAGDLPEIRASLFRKVNTAFQAYIIISAVAVFFLPEIVYELWVGQALGHEVRNMVILLLPAYAVRLLTSAFTTFVMAYGAQEKLFLSPLLEGAVAVTGCMVFGYFLGLEGIPMALFISAVVRLAMTVAIDSKMLNHITAITWPDLIFPARHFLKVRT